MEYLSSFFINLCSHVIQTSSKLIVQRVFRNMTRTPENGPDHPTDIEKSEVAPDLRIFKRAHLESQDIRAIQMELAEMKRDPKRYIDRGGTGTVHRFAKRLCVKVLEPRSTSPRANIMKLGNPVDVEAAFLSDLANLEVKGVRVPVCFGFWREGPKSLEAGILMEELDAENLQHVLNRKAPLPNSFQADRFMSALENFIEMMHTKEGIFHGDLAPRNIMIDRTSGMPRVIDFGRARRIEHLSDDEKKRALKEEWDKIDAMTEKIEELTP